MVRDHGLRSGFSQEAADDLAADGNGARGWWACSAPSGRHPADVCRCDRDEVQGDGRPPERRVPTLQLYLGGYYVNDFNQFGRTWQVNLQADPGFRLTPERHEKLKVPQSRREMVPLGSVADVARSAGRCCHPLQLRCGRDQRRLNAGHQLRADHQGRRSRVQERTAPGHGLSVDRIDATCRFRPATSPFSSSRCRSCSSSWCSPPSTKAGLPLAVILVVPMCLSVLALGVAWPSMDINIFVQIGFVVLVGLACKNAILIVEFAQERAGRRHPRSTRRRSLPVAVAADHHDVVRVHPRRGAAGAGRWAPGRDAAHAGHRGVRGHARRDDLRHLPDAGLLCAGPPWRTGSVPICAIRIACCASSGSSAREPHLPRSNGSVRRAPSPTAYQAPSSTAGVGGAGVGPMLSRHLWRSHYA